MAQVSVKKGLLRVHVAYLRLAFSTHVSSAVLVVPARSLRHHVPGRTVFVELYPTHKRVSSALPHERRGVWLPGRSHALQSPDGSGPDLDGMCPRSFDAQFKELRDMLFYHSQGVLPITKATSRPSPTPCVLLTSRITNIEQIVSTFATKMATFAEMEQNVISITTRICKIEAGATSASGGSCSASSWNLLGQSDGSTATGPLGSHGPGSSDDNRNTKRRLVFSQAQRMNMREVPSIYSFHVNNSTLGCLLVSRSSAQRPTHHLSTSLSEFIPLSLYLKQEPSVKTLWRDTKMTVSPTKCALHFATSVPKSQSASPSLFRIEKLEDDLHLLQSYKTSSQNGMQKILSVSLLLTFVHKSSAFWTARTGWENLPTCTTRTRTVV